MRRKAHSETNGGRSQAEASKMSPGRPKGIPMEVEPQEVESRAEPKGRRHRGSLQVWSKWLMGLRWRRGLKKTMVEAKPQGMWSPFDPKGWRAEV